jgi:23S rRNA (guanine745-N1)-methyltransferase
MCVFAPRNAAEFARVLVPGGLLLVVTPRENHLRELRESGAMLGIQPDKRATLDAGLTASFALVDRQALEYSVQLDAPAQLLVAAMGPAGHHERDVTPVDAGEITVAVDLSVYGVR